MLEFESVWTARHDAARPFLIAATFDHPQQQLLTPIFSTCRFRVSRRGPVDLLSTVSEAMHLLRRKTFRWQDTGEFSGEEGLPDRWIRRRRWADPRGGGGGMSSDGVKKRDFQEVFPARTEDEFYSRYDPKLGLNTALLLSSLLVLIMANTVIRWIYRRCRQAVHSTNWYQRRQCRPTKSLGGMMVGLFDIEHQGSPVKLHPLRNSRTDSTAITSLAASSTFNKLTAVDDNMVLMEEENTTLDLFSPIAPELPVAGATKSAQRRRRAASPPPASNVPDRPSIQVDEVVPLSSSSSSSPPSSVGSPVANRRSQSFSFAPSGRYRRHFGGNYLNCLQSDRQRRPTTDQVRKTILGEFGNNAAVILPTTSIVTTKATIEWTPPPSDPVVLGDYQKLSRVTSTKPVVGFSDTLIQNNLAESAL